MPSDEGQKLIYRLKEEIKARIRFENFLKQVEDDAVSARDEIFEIKQGASK